MPLLDTTGFGSVIYDLKGKDLERKNEIGTAKFSLNAPVERVKDLVAVHNVKETDLSGMFELGGMPVPSIAVVKDSMGHDKYGDISFLFHSDTIDPEKSRYNKVYGGDAYTPTFPAVRYKTNEEIQSKLRDLYYDNYKELGGDKLRGLYNYTEGLEDSLNTAGGEAELIKMAKKDIRLMQSYLAIQGKEVEDIYKTEETSLTDSEVEMVERFINELGEDVVRELEVPEGETDRLAYKKGWFDKHETEIEAAYTKWMKEDLELDDETIKKVLDDQTKRGYIQLFNKALRFLKEGPTIKSETYDADATREAITEAAKEAGFDSWVDETFKGVEAGKGIRNNKDMFTNMGNRRSWDTLHDPVTLENVVAIMRNELDAGANGFLGSNPKGAAQKSYKSLDEIRADEGRLEMLSDEEYSEQSEKALDLLSSVCSDIVASNPQRFDNQFGANLDVGNYIAEVLNETRNKDKMHKLLNRDYGMTVSDEQMDRIMEAIEAIAEVPTGYFEAKPKRAVGFDEVKTALVPKGMDAELTTQLKDRGVEVVEYDPEVEGDRLAKLNQAADTQGLKFSLTPEQQKLDNDYMDAVNNNDMETAQRLVEEAANNSGFKVKVYHGTNAQNIDIFTGDPNRMEKNGPNRIKGYFSDQERYSEDYGENVNAYYLNEDDFLYVDGAFTIEEMAEQLKKAGVTDVEFNEQITEEKLKNWFDSWGGEYGEDIINAWMFFNENGGNITERVEAAGYKGVTWQEGYEIAEGEGYAYMPFESTAVKLADAVTYAEDGSVIPLSERFNPENDSVRYSLPTTDADGKVLTDGQMEYFSKSEARDAQGRLVRVFHSTNKGGFTIFDPSFSDDKRSLFFTSNRKMSESYAKETGDVEFGKVLPVPEEIWDLEDLANYFDKHDEVAGEMGVTLSIWNLDDDSAIYDTEGYSGEGDIRDFIEAYPDIDENKIGFEIYDMQSGGMLAEGEGIAELSDELIDSINHLNRQDRFAEMPGTYSCYLNLENPMIIDCKGANWDSIKEDGFEEIRIHRIKDDLADIWDDEDYQKGYVIDTGHGTQYISIEEVAEQFGQEMADQVLEFNWNDAYESGDLWQDFYTWEGAAFNPEEEGHWPMEGNTRFWCNEAEAMGYDGVIFLNLMDNGPHGYGTEVGDVYVAFNSNQIKDINNENPTENPDIRYSIVEEDDALSRIAYEDAMDDSYEALNYYENLINEVDPETYTIKPFDEERVSAFYQALKQTEAVVSSDPVLEEDRVRMAKSKQDFFNSLNAKWNARWTTDHQVLDVKSVRKDIKNLVMGVMANSDTDAKYRNELVKKMLMDVRTAYQLMKQDRQDVAAALLYHSALRMVEGAEFYVDDGYYDRYLEIKDYFRNTKIALGTFTETIPSP